MERREIKYGKALNKDKQIGKVRELEKDEEKKGRPEWMTNMPGNPMNYKEVSQVTAIRFRFPLFLVYLKPKGN